MTPQRPDQPEAWQYRMTSGESFRWRHAARSDQENMARELVFRVAEQAHQHGLREFVIRDCNGEPIIRGSCRACRTRRFDPHRFDHLYNLN